MGGAEFWQKLLLRPKTRAESCVYNSLVLPCQPSLALAALSQGPRRGLQGRGDPHPLADPIAQEKIFIPRQYFYSWPVAAPQLSHCEGSRAPALPPYAIDVTHSDGFHQHDEQQ